MTFEGFWYSMYSADGDAPHCTRYCRLPMAQQWELVIDLAISFACGTSGYRKVFISRTGEQYWYWPHDLAPTGWWLIPARIAERGLALNRAACEQVFQVNHGSADSRAIVAVLKSWKRTGAWRKYAAVIWPRHAKPKPEPKRRGRPRKVAE